MGDDIVQDMDFSSRNWESILKASNIFVVCYMFVSLPCIVGLK